MERLPAWPGKGRSGKKGHSVMGDIVSLVAKRLGLGLLTLFVVSILIFFAVELLPGDIAEGDYVVLSGMGAYSTATNTRFNGFGALTIATVMRLDL